jgi:hypothetical protein
VKKLADDEAKFNSNATFSDNVDKGYVKKPAKDEAKLTAMQRSATTWTRAM